jgi:hypothetical protein
VRTGESPSNAPERTLTERELNRALLARQLLLERAALPIPRAIEAVGGLQTQYAPSGYVGLWTRVADVARDDLTRALKRRTVVQGTLMRETIHMVSRRDYPLLAAGIREDLRAWWLRTRRSHPGAKDIAKVAGRVRTFLADGPKPRAEIMKALGLDNVLFGGARLWVELVRVPPRGTWEQRRADVYGLAEDWVGPLDASREDGIELLVRRFLGGFGPATRKDIAGWAGLAVSSVAPILDRMKLRRFADERGEELLDLPRAPLPDPETPAPVRMLPTFDPTLLVHSRRTQILPERYRPVVFSTRTPHSIGTFLVDGQVAGSWTQRGADIHLEPFGRLPRSTRREVDDEAERLRAFVS